MTNEIKANIDEVIKEKINKAINEVKASTDSSTVLLFCSDDNSYSSKLKDMYKDDESIKVMTVPTKYLGDNKEDIDTKIFVIPNMDKPVKYVSYPGENIEQCRGLRSNLMLYEDYVNFNI